MSESSDNRLAANVLGALALHVGGLLGAAATAASGRGLADTTTLVVLRSVAPDSSQDDLARLLGLTQSAVTRLVDRLVRDGLVERRRGADWRTVSLRLTTAGDRLADDVTAARMAALVGLTDGLDDEGRRRLVDLAGELIAPSIRQGADPVRTCRLCDLTACHDLGTCPVTHAARHVATGRPRDLTGPRPDDPVTDQAVTDQAAT
ncbi:MAG: MarR family winged helix-turn-helix transcriptional regulator [Phycicoccus sp.]